MKKLFEIPEIDVTYFDDDEILTESTITGIRGNVSSIEGNEKMAVMKIDVQDNLDFTF